MLITKRINAAIKFEDFSYKQKQVLTWWCDGSPAKNAAGIICDGSIRAGKTVSMAMSYVFWAMSKFNNCQFAFCGRTVGAFRRNVWSWLYAALLSRGYKVYQIKNENIIIIQRGHVTNYFYIFGGQNESSQDLVQGGTWAGAFFDEVALMPESFVNQATGRCSIDGAKWWFNCNPEEPLHYFKTDWIDLAADKNLLHLHFMMDDNPSLTAETRLKYENTYKGVFHRRFILGEWVVAEGAIYKDVWGDENTLLFSDNELPIGARNNTQYRRYIWVDYGTVNPCTFLDVIDDGTTYWVVNQYYYDSRAPGNDNYQKSDTEYADDMEEFIGNYELRPRAIVIDPSASSFKVELNRRRRFVEEVDAEVVNASNAVNEGIRRVSIAIRNRLLRFHRENCKPLIKEMLSYSWDEKAIKKGLPEKPIKKNDHSPDGIRYGVMTIIPEYRLYTKTIYTPGQLISSLKNN